MITGCGIDTEERYRFNKHIDNINDSDFISTVFSETEIESFKHFNPSLCTPIAFCCKEAIFKALGNSWTTSALSWKDIEIIFEDIPEKKKYKINLTGEAKSMLKEKNNSRIISDYDYNDDYITFEIILINE